MVDARFHSRRVRGEETSNGRESWKASRRRVPLGCWSRLHWGSRFLPVGALWLFGRTTGVDPLLTKSEWVAAVVSTFEATSHSIAPAAETLRSRTVTAVVAARLSPVRWLHGWSVPVGVSDAADQAHDRDPEEQGWAGVEQWMMQEQISGPFPRYNKEQAKEPPTK
jgi:hypothetical protein